MTKIYLIGSLRNPEIPEIAVKLREQQFDVFDDWFAAGEKADDSWRAYENSRGRTYGEALQGYAAKHVYEFDKKHLDNSDIAVLVTPAGKSGHLELGYAIGKEIPGYVMFNQEPERWDVMYQFCSGIFFNYSDLEEYLIEEHPTKGGTKNG